MSKSIKIVHYVGFLPNCSWNCLAKIFNHINYSNQNKACDIGVQFQNRGRGTSPAHSHKLLALNYVFLDFVIPNYIKQNGPILFNFQCL